MPGLRKKWLRVGVAALFAFGLLSAVSAAGPFSSLVVFGDSLSDVGNISSATGGTYPGKYYWSSRFSNGPVYAEAVATGLGLPPLTRSTAGGNDFAYGGARTSGTGGFEGLFIRDLDEQVDQFVSSRTADANALFIVWASANDFIGGQTNVNVPVSNLAEDIGRLIAKGARKFLVPNLPLLGKTPRFNGNPTTANQYNTRTASYNSALETMLNGLEVGNPLLTIFRLDVAGLFNDAISNPAIFGLTNVTQAAAAGLQPGDSSYNTNQIAPNANQYLFWDDLHPTATVHAALAEATLDLLLREPGDFNHDGVVDATDYVVWRDEGGTAGAYDEWKANFGAGANGAIVAANLSLSVPEPASILIGGMAILVLVVRRLRR